MVYSLENVWHHSEFHLGHTKLCFTGKPIITFVLGGRQKSNEYQYEYVYGYYAYTNHVSLNSSAVRGCMHIPATLYTKICNKMRCLVLDYPIYHHGNTYSACYVTGRMQRIMPGTARECHAHHGSNVLNSLKFRPAASVKHEMKLVWPKKCALHNHKYFIGTKLF